jgi:predicted deacylase
MASTMKIGNITCEPGEMQFGAIPGNVYLRDGSEVQIPLIVVNGVKDGPVLWLGGMVHGNELPGIEVIRRVVRETVDPEALRGTILACPVQHPLTYHSSNRLTPHDGININRVFPGNPRGSWTERLAHTLFHEGVMKADVVLDFHSNAAGAINFNVVRTGVEGPAWDEQWPLAEAFGFTIAVGEVGQAGFDSPLVGLLQTASLAVGKPSLTVEFTGMYVLEENSVQAGVKGTLNVMKYLDMLDGEIEPQTGIQVIDDPLTNRHPVSVDKGGVVLPLVPPGEKVGEGQPIARLYDVYGDELETVRSPIEGWVMTFPHTGNRTLASGGCVAFVYGS